MGFVGGRGHAGSGVFADTSIRLWHIDSYRYRYEDASAEIAGVKTHHYRPPGVGQAGSEYFPLGDQVNTPHEVVDVNSVVANHIVSNTFGVVASESNAAIHHWAGFGGGHFDPDTATVIDYHRVYDPFDGVWENEDPKGFAAGDSNLGRYSHNNAVMLVDPAGLQEGTNPSLAYIPPPAWLLAQEQAMIENLIIQNQQAMAAAQQQYILAQQAYQMAAQNIPTLSARRFAVRARSTITYRYR